MLCITRKLGESVVVILEDGTECRVHLFEQDRSKRGGKGIRMGLDFPKSARIVRGEIHGIEPQPKPSLAAILKHRRD